MRLNAGNEEAVQQRRAAACLLREEQAKEQREQAQIEPGLMQILRNKMPWLNSTKKNASDESWDA